MSGNLFRRTWAAQRGRLLLVMIALAIWGFLLPVVYATFGNEMGTLARSPLAVALGHPAAPGQGERGQRHLPVHGRGRPAFGAVMVLGGVEPFQLLFLFVTGLASVFV